MGLELDCHATLQTLGLLESWMYQLSREHSKGNVHEFRSLYIYVHLMYIYVHLMYPYVHLICVDVHQMYVYILSSTLIVFESQKAKNSWTKNSSELKISALHARKNRPSWRKSWPLRKCRRKLLNCRRKSDYRAICKKNTAHCHYLQYTDCYSSFSAKILFPSNQKHVKHTAAFNFF